MAKLTPKEVRQIQKVLDSTELVVVALGIQPTHLLSEAWVEYFKILSIIHETIVWVEFMLPVCERPEVTKSLHELRQSVEQAAAMFECCQSVANEHE